MGAVDAWSWQQLAHEWHYVHVTITRRCAVEAFRDAPYGISSDPLLGRQDLLGVVDGLRVIIIGRSRVIGGVTGHVISHVASC